MPVLSHKNRKSGQAIITATVLFLFISTTVILGISAPVYSEVRTMRDVGNSKASYFASESGSEDVIYRIKNNLQVDDSESLSFNNALVTTTTVDDIDSKIITSYATTSALVRKVGVSLVLGEGFSFNYGVQVGDGGLHMKNTSSVLGNVFSNGPITTDNFPSISGDAVSAGLNGLIDNINIIGDAYSNTLKDVVVGQDAYYKTISGSIVGGNSYPDSPDQATTTMPIPDSVIIGWENQALAGGVSTDCNLDSDMTIGPIKFDCQTLTIDGNPTITLAGPVWVEGSIEIEGSSVIRVSPTISNSLAFIAHDPSNELTGGKIIIKNSTQFSGSQDNYVLMISMNRDAKENNGGVKAIEVRNSAEGDLLVYAPYGLVQLRNSVDLKEVTAYQIELQNSAQVVYETGLANLLFDSGPSGGYSINSWREVE